MNQKRIGKFIKEKRIEKDLTQVVLAEKLGVSNRSISKWENGVCLPDYSVLNDLCKILDISIDELLAGEEKLKKNDEDKKMSIVKISVIIFVILIILFILYKLFIIFYFDNKFHYTDKVFSNDKVSNIEVKYNDKYSYDFNDNDQTISYYVPSKYKLITDKADSDMVMDNCNLYVAGFVCKNNWDSYISICYNGYNNLNNLDYYGIESEFFPSLNVHRLLDKYKINNIIDLIKYYENNMNYHNTIFTSSDRIKMNYIADRYTNIVLGSGDFYYLNGDVLGYLQKMSDKYYHSVVTFKRDLYNYDTYNISFYNASYDDVIKIISSIQYN